MSGDVKVKEFKDLEMEMLTHSSDSIKLLWQEKNDQIFLKYVLQDETNLGFSMINFKPLNLDEIINFLKIAQIEIEKRKQK